MPLAKLLLIIGGLVFPAFRVDRHLDIRVSPASRVAAAAADYHVESRVVLVVLVCQAYGLAMSLK